MGEICRQTIGRAPVGFRSPGWNIDDATIPFLKKHGYLYDSSIFPTSIMPVMKYAHWQSMSKQDKVDRTTMGQMNYMFAPIKPYHTSPDSLSKIGNNGLIEFPITVTKKLRIPFFATTSLFSGSMINRLIYHQICKHQIPIHFQMHLSDFVDYSLPELSDQMPATGSGVRLPQALHTPLTKKLKLFGEIIELIHSDYELLTLENWAKRICDEE